jgi:hypothetical protein
MTIYDIVDISYFVSDEMYNKVTEELLSAVKTNKVKKRLVSEDPYTVFVEEFNLNKTCSKDELEDFRERLL